MTSTTSSVPQMEERLVWLHDPAAFRYVRAGRALTTRRRGRLGLGPGDILVGYAECRKHGRGIQSYSRRFWWLKRRDLEPGGTRPVEAVDPSSIAAADLASLSLERH
jgi:hypothetical protein